MENQGRVDPVREKDTASQRQSETDQAQATGDATRASLALQRRPLDPRALSPAAVRALQRTAGNAAVTHLLLQRATQAPRSLARGSTLSPVQQQAAAPAHQAEADLGARIQAAGGRGSPLPPGLQRTLESNLDADLSAVRVHTDGEADHLSRAVDAVAFTTGPDIFFRHGAYDPDTPQGAQLLAHEATHAVQQAQGPVAGTTRADGVSISDPSDRFEQAAEATAARIAAGGAVQRAAGGPASQAAHGGTHAPGNARPRHRAAWGSSVAVQRSKYKVPVVKDQFGETYHIAGAMLTAALAGQPEIVPDLSQANDAQKAFLMQIYRRLHPFHLATKAIDLSGAASLELQGTTDIVTQVLGDAKLKDSAEFQLRHMWSGHDEEFADGGASSDAIRTYLGAKLGDAAKVPKAVIFNRQKAGDQAGGRNLSAGTMGTIMGVSRKMLDIGVFINVGDAMSSASEGVAKELGCRVLNFQGFGADAKQVGLDTYTFQLNVYRLLHEEFGVQFNIGMKSGAMDGPAMIGIPTIFIDMTGTAAGRMGKLAQNVGGKGEQGPAPLPTLVRIPAAGKEPPPQTRSNKHKGAAEQENIDQADLRPKMEQAIKLLKANAPRLPMQNNTDADTTASAATASPQPRSRSGIALAGDDETDLAAATKESAQGHYQLTDRQAKLLAHNNLEEVPVDPDGNCLFEAFARTRGIGGQREVRDRLVAELRDLEDPRFAEIRAIAGAHYQRDFLENLARKETFDFAGVAGDLMPRIIATVYGVRLILVKEKGNPAKIGDAGDPVVLVYFSEGALHYHGTRPRAQ